jgi:hypothetical protein
MGIPNTVHIAWHSTGCFKKSFTILKAYIHLFRGHVQLLELSQRGEMYIILIGIVMVNESP